MSSVSYRDVTGTVAENYQRYFVPTIATAVSASLLGAAELQRGERALDVACGTGLIARLAAGQVGPAGSVTGIDLSPDMIEVARTTPSGSDQPIEWRVGDATALPLPDGGYDVALCQMGLMFMADRPAAVAEMRRVLAPGGRLAVSTPGQIQPVFEIMEQAIIEHLAPELGAFVSAVFSMHDPAAVSTLLSGAGLKAVESTVSTASFHLPPPAEFLWQYINLTPMGPVVAQAPEAAKSALEEQFAQRCAPYVADGETRVEQPMVIATGRR